MSNNTIEIKVNSGGTLEVVTIPVKLYKDSYKAVKLRVKVPKTDGTILKVYGSDRDEAGEEVWTTSAYSLPYKNDEIINNQTYNVYEDYIPEEFCAKNGELFLTFSQGIMDGEIWNAIITSGTLNLYVSGEGFNYAGVEIPESDKLAYKINELFENLPTLNNDVDKLEQNFSELSDDFDKIEQDINELSEKTSHQVTLDTPQTITAWKEFSINSNTGESFVLDHDSINMKINLKHTDSKGDYNEIDLSKGSAKISLSNDFWVDSKSGQSLYLGDYIELKRKSQSGEVSYIQLDDDNITLNHKGKKTLNVKDDGIYLGSYDWDKATTIRDVEEYTGNNFVSYSSYQSLTEDEKRRARYNIGVNDSDSDYQNLTNKPSINGVVLSGNKNSADLGIIDKNANNLVNYYSKNEVIGMVSQISSDSKEYSDDNFISYNKLQNLTEQQKQTARNNIGAGTGIDNTVDNLVNYYLKNETYSKDEVNQIVGSIKGFKKEIVNELPTVNADENTIYLKLKADGSGNDYYDEYLYINGAFEFIGSTRVNLLNYVTIDSAQTISGDKNFTGKLTSNGKELLVGGELVDKVTQIKNTSGSIYSLLDLNIIDGVMIECGKGTNSNSYIQLDLGYILMGANQGLDYNSSYKLYTLADGKNKSEMPIQCIFGAEKRPKFMFKTRDYDVYENYTEFEISPTGVMYNGKEVATKDDIQSAIITTLNTEV
jgi:hypothetical protein